MSSDDRNLFQVCSPDGAQRNPGFMLDQPSPDFAALHPGYAPDGRLWREFPNPRRHRRTA
jgi:hypothetical protein